IYFYVSCVYSFDYMFIILFLFFFYFIFFFFFFFSSRRRHTRWPRDWSSDVCSSDLHRVARVAQRPHERLVEQVLDHHRCVPEGRSEERRVGKECRSRGGREH